MLRRLWITTVRPRHRTSHAPARNRFTAGVALLALLMMTHPAAARTIFPIKGGSGDAGFEDRCPANEFLIGLAGRTGDFIDQVRIICAPVLTNGTHGPSYYGPSRGGTGGAAAEFSCNADAFVSGFTFYHYNEHAKVFDVELSCRSMQGNAKSTVDFGPQMGVSFSNDDSAENQQCSSDELASGLAGRYGKNVNALGLFCDARIIGSAPAPASDRSAWPIRTTGKVTATSASATDRSAWPVRTTGKATTPADATLACPQGFVWRAASPADHVCVTPVQRMLTRQENAAGPAHVSQADQTYGSNTCVQGYVWREAFSGDIVCVTPRQRDAAAEQNSAAPAQIPATSP